jgi:hypothetical protein
MSGSFRAASALGLVAALVTAGALLGGEPVSKTPAGDKETEKGVAALKAELAQLQAEVAALRKELAAREKRILQQAVEVEAQRRRTAAVEATAKAALSQVRTLTERLQETQRELAKQRAGGAGVPGKQPKGAKPPPGDVKGKIEKIAPDNPGLVTLSVGSDHGLQVGHTLEVFRLKPQPKYLGRVEILDVGPRSSVARLKGRLPKGETLEVGDEVASTLR